ncbi:MAG TPA: lysine-sensitive aspartokinase 3 [Thermoanaerobaculia bacterium]|nr:lysine-sensitive aspartokinase 3 [Thermoanaerobaculia bacterium]
MIIIKFGGTSVGSTATLRDAIEIVAARRERNPIVVVSALSGVTNQLVAASQAAAAGRVEEMRQIVQEIEARHQEIAFELVQQKSDYLEMFQRQLAREMAQIGAILEGMALVGEITPRAHDKIVAIGEKLSSVLFAYTMRLKMLTGVHVDSEDVVVTDDEFGAANPDMDATRESARRQLLPEVERNHIPVMGGFIGRSRSGATTTLGRGGSDFSAAILGAVLDAAEIQIWTDVDGMMTADPRVIATARIIDRISYVEAAELAYFGAKVLHPKTIAPAVERAIPIRVLNTHNPASAGTLITREGDEQGKGPRAVAMKRGITILHMTSERMLGAHGFLGSIFEVFGRLRVAVDLVTTSEVSVSVTIDRDDRLPELLRALAPIAEVRAERDQAIIAMVGRSVLGDNRVATAVFEALRQIPISMISLGRSGLNLSLVMQGTDADRAMLLLHEAIFERVPEGVGTR